MTATKDKRLAVRVSNDQDALTRHAAETEAMTVTDPTVRATVAHAQDVLADRRLFILDDEAWTHFQAALDEPVQYRPRLGKLFDQPSFFA